MVITSAILYYQLAKKCQLVSKKAPSDKLQINNIKFYNGKTEVGNLYLVDCKEVKKPIVAKKPVSLIYFNAHEFDLNSIPKNCDYAIFEDVKNIFEISELVYECVNELQNWDCKLKDGLTYRLPLEEFGELARNIIDEDLYLLTRNFVILPLSGDSLFKNNDTISVKLVRRLLSDKEYEKTTTCTNTYVYKQKDYESLSLNIFSNGKYIARLSSKTKYYEDSLDEGYLGLFLHYFRYLKHVYLRYSDDPLIKNNKDKLHSLVESLIINPTQVDDMEANLILQNYGWSKNDKYSIIKFSFFKNTKWDEMTEYICGKLEETWSNSCAIIFEDNIVWLFNHSITKSSADEHKFFHVLAYIVRDFVCKAGVSDYYRDITKSNLYLKQANAALLTGQRNASSKWYYKFQDYALDYMYDQIALDLSLDQLIIDGIKKLIDYDIKNNTDYLNTLRSYILNNCNSTHTADELYIHRTTLIRRIERIQELCNIDFEDKNTFLYLQISLWMLEKNNFMFNNPNAIREETLQ